MPITADVSRIPTPRPTAVHTGDADDAPGPFPVTIVRPAMTALPPLTAVQRDRRRAASRLAAILTAAAVRVKPPKHDTVDLYLPVDVAGEDIIREAPRVAAAAPPGAVQVGRDRHGRAVAVAVHGEGWSLVLDAATIRNHGWRPPVTWVFLDRPDDPDRFEPHDIHGRAYLATSFDNECGVEGAAWAHTVATVLALATAPARIARPGCLTFDPDPLPATRSAIRHPSPSGGQR